MDSVFIPDSLATLQWADITRSKELDGEHKLMLAVFNATMNDFFDNIDSTSKSRQILFEQAKAWIFDNTIDYAFSFLNACDEFKMSPDAIRRKCLEKLASR